MNVATEQHRTRAQVMRDKVKVRLAPDEAGPKIEYLLHASGVHLPCDKVFPNWLIATVDDDVIGCIQVIPARPMGYVNFLCVAGGSAKLNAIAVRKLGLAGLSSVYAYGAKVVTANVPAGMKFMDVLKRLNFVQVNETATLIKRLTDE